MSKYDQPEWYKKAASEPLRKAMFTNELKRKVLNRLQDEQNRSNRNFLKNASLIAMASTAVILIIFLLRDIDPFIDITGSKSTIETLSEEELYQLGSDTMNINFLGEVLEKRTDGSIIVKNLNAAELLEKNKEGSNEIKEILDPGLLFTINLKYNETAEIGIGTIYRIKGHYRAQGNSIDVYHSLFFAEYFEELHDHLESRIEHNYPAELTAWNEEIVYQFLDEVYQYVNEIPLVTSSKEQIVKNYHRYFSLELSEKIFNSLYIKMDDNWVAPMIDPKYKFTVPSGGGTGIELTLEFNQQYIRIKETMENEKNSIFEYIIRYQDKPIITEWYSHNIQIQR